MANLISNQMKPNEQKIRFQGIAHVFLVCISVFVILNEILIFFLGFTKFLEFYGINSRNKSAIGFVMSIK